VKAEPGVKREPGSDASGTGGDDDDVLFVSARRLHHRVTLDEDGVEIVDLGCRAGGAGANRAAQLSLEQKSSAALNE
jgi:hypothetical protein